MGSIPTAGVAGGCTTWGGSAGGGAAWGNAATNVHVTNFSRGGLSLASPISLPLIGDHFRPHLPLLYPPDGMVLETKIIFLKSKAN